MISLDGSNSFIHDNLRSFTGAYDLTINGIKNLIEARKVKNGETFICTNTVIVNYNLNDLPAISKMLAEMGVDAVNLQVFLPNSEDGTNSLKVTQKKLGERKNIEAFSSGMEDMLHAGSSLFVAKIIHMLINEERLVNKCLSPAVSLFITQNGDVYPCCFISERDEFVMGNIRHENLKNIWHKEAFRKLRRDFLKGVDHEVCRKCTTLSETSSKLYLRR